MRFDRRLAPALPVLAIAGALGATLLFGGPNGPVIAQDTAKMTEEQRSTATSLEGAFMKIAETVEPATVHITARIQPSARQGSRGQNDEGFFPFGDLLPPGLRGMPRAPRFGRRASGSGVIVRQDGYILTNDHVVADAADGRVTVTLDDGREFRGTVLRDRRSDIAVVKIDTGKPLPYVRMADSDKVKVGQWAVAIGSPFGLQQTMTAGIISALQRKAPIGRGDQARYYPNLIQTDASINPGNSGGPLLNINGELIGINVAIESPTGASAGIGFAIPANTARSVMEQLITRGKVTRGYLGLLPADIPAGLRTPLGAEKGAYVAEVSPDTPAEKAGILPEDVITRFGNKEITDEVTLRDAISATAPGTRVPVTLLRNGKAQTVDVIVGTPEEDRVATSAPAEGRPASKLGINLDELTADMVREMKLPAGTRGVVVGGIEPGSPAFEAGLAPRDVITAVNGSPITTISALDRAVAQAKSGDIVTLRILRFRDSEKPSRAVVNVTVP